LDLFRDGDMFFEATAVLMAEVLKLVTTLLLVFNDEGRDVNKYFKSLYQTIWVNKVDTLKVS
jgi:UDP-sugar transporter A1/2/3